MKAERIFINGNIYTMDDDNFHAEALVVAGQTLLCAGSEGEAMAFAGPETEVVDLQGNTVIPGLIDSHIHTLLAADMFDTEFVVTCFDRTKEEIIQAVGEIAKKRRPGECIQ